MSHSPLPWTVHESGEIIDANGVFVASIEGEVETPNDDGNRGMIVTAVNHHAKLAGALDSCLTQIEQMAGMFPDDDGAIKNAADSAREVLASVRGQRPEKLVLQQAEPEQSETLKLLAWCIAQFDGTSGAGLNHWIQSPEYRRACELIGQELPPHDPDDEEADEQPVSDANKLPEPRRDAMQTALDALRSVAEIVENTFDHDEDGDRIDDVGEYSAADIFEQVTNVDAEVAGAIEALEEAIEDANIPARVWIEVSGGVAHYESEGNVIVELTDYDNEEDEEEDD